MRFLPLALIAACTAAPKPPADWQQYDQIVVLPVTTAETIEDRNLSQFAAARIREAVMREIDRRGVIRSARYRGASTTRSLLLQIELKDVEQDHGTRETFVLGGGGIRWWPSEGKFLAYSWSMRDASTGQYVGRQVGEGMLMSGVNGSGGGHAGAAEMWSHALEGFANDLFDRAGLGPRAPTKKS